jgi:hypothetical protein
MRDEMVMVYLKDWGTEENHSKARKIAYLLVQ